MTIATINMLVSILAGMKLNKITDKEVKSTLVNDYLYLRKFVKETEADRKELVDKFQEDWKDELGAVEAYRQADKPIVGHAEYLEAEKDANEAISALFAKEVEAEVRSIPMDAFLASCGAEELTLEQLAFLQENGVVE